MFLSSLFEKDFLKRKSSGLIALALLCVTLLSLVLFKPDTAFFQNLLSRMCVVFRGPVTIFCYL